MSDAEAQARPGGSLDAGGGTFAAKEPNAGQRARQTRWRARR